MTISIAQRLEKGAQEAAQLRIDASEGYALLNALAVKWWEQGYMAGVVGLDPERINFWTDDHARGYAAAAALRTSQAVHA